MVPRPPFGAFLTPEQVALTGPTCDPNNPDTDGDGMYDGIELLFTQWNQSDEVWTLNPLVPVMAITMLIKMLSPICKNSISPCKILPMVVCRLLTHRECGKRRWHERECIFATYQLDAVRKGQSSNDCNQQYLDWRSNPNIPPPPPLLSTIIGITDPTNNDTDSDQMIDGYEYWFTEWDLDGNQWENESPLCLM